MDFQSVLSFASFVILGAVVYMLGEGVKAWARKTLSGRVRAFYEWSLWFHPVAVCLGVYQLPGFPLPEGWATVVARALLGVACGLSTSLSYKLYRKALRDA
jgi:hypothetical protein